MQPKIDKDLITVFLQRGWSSLSGIATIYFIAQYLTADQQGAYYLIAALSTIITFFDFGLKKTNIQNVAKIKGGKNQNNEKLEKCKSILSNSKKKSTYYAITYCILVFGFLNFNFEKLQITKIESLLTLLILSITSSLTLRTNIYIAFMEGDGNIKNSARFKLISMVCGSIVLWVGIYLGYGIASLLVSQILSTTIIYTLTQIHQKSTIGNTKHNSKVNIKISTNNQIKIALSGFSAYLVLNIPTYYLGIRGDLISAGKFGMTFQLLGAISGFSIVFLNSKLYIYCGLYQKQDINKLKAYHKQRIMLSWIFLLASITGIAIAFWMLPESTSAIRLKIIDTEFYGLALITLLGINYYNCQSVLLQSKGGDPLFFIGVLRIAILAIAISITASFTGNIYSLEISYAIMTIATIIATFFASRSFLNES